MGRHLLRAVVTLMLALALTVSVSAGQSYISQPGRASATDLALSSSVGKASESPLTSQRALDAYGKLPLGFIPNKGQTDARVRFHAQAPGANFWFTQTAAVFAFTKKSKGAALRLSFLGANPTPKIQGIRPGPGRINHLVGSDPSKWHTGLPAYGQIVYRELWPGIDMVFRGGAGTLKYEFVLRPGARVTDIRLAYKGSGGLSVSKAGGLMVRTPLGVLRDERPFSYQVVGGQHIRVGSRFALKQDARGYGFAVGSYDRLQPLVIDPGLVYSTYLGGNQSDVGQDIAIDAGGNAYITGYTDSTDFPTTVGAFDTARDAQTDAFVTKLNAAGSALVYSTYLGGSQGDFGLGLALDASGSAYVIGYTGSTDFPTTAGAFDTTQTGNADAFVTKLDTTGSALSYSTYLGGSLLDIGYGVFVDAAGSASVTGETGSTDFPTTAGAYDATYNGNTDAFVTKLDPAGSTLIHSTYLGGSGFDNGSEIRLDSSGSVFLAGGTTSTNLPTTVGAFDATYNGNTDAFVTKLNATASALVYSTYLGGGAGDSGGGLALDAAGSAHVSGGTTSTDFPTTAGAFDATYNGNTDAFVAKLNPAGSSLAYSTYLGGGGLDAGNAIALDPGGSAYVIGFTGSTDFPTTAGAFDTTYGGFFDAFVSKLNVAGSSPLLYSTFLGGNGEFSAGLGIVTDASGAAYVTGFTRATDFPTSAGAFDMTWNGGSSFDAFVTKLSTADEEPAIVTLDPETAVNPVGTSHTVTATATTLAGDPVEGVVIRFTTTGSATRSGSCTTDANGQCSFTYTGPALPGADLIRACADNDGSGTIGPDEPCGEATKAWLLPATTPGQVTGGGQVPGTTDDVAFGFNAKSTTSGLNGNCSAVDPATDTNVKCLDVTTLVRSGTHATFFGNATVNGVATTYRIDVDDLGEPGAGQDTFRVQTASGYTAGGVLTHGNIKIHN